ncbi:MAG: single-stranded-DNA-specific exonuclease RecJ [Alphaproteobacteria bacterium]|nr:single-stranded-DNA-specific exonuclease RecJ [Alphaproteobacteria bacterium]
MPSSAVIVERSLSKARWILPDIDLSAVERLVRKHNLPEIVARLLCVRGVEESQVEHFLHPTLQKDFPDPFSLAGMGGLADDMARFIQEGRSFAIFGDFDVDGATSSALLHRFLKACGVEAPIYIPERLSEGYGPNIEALTKLKKAGADILFLLDCGTTAFETVAEGAALGLQIVIADHHEAEERLPEALHVINPKRKDDMSGLDVMAAVGVTFMMCVAINNRLRESGFFEGRSVPKLKDWLDLVALGTVCDMVPLTGVNRLFVRHGFERMNRTDNAGLKALIEVSGISGPVSPYHAGFVLGPRINAGSRVHRSDLGAALLATDDPEEAKNTAWTLNDCNDKRKAIQREMEEAAIAQVEAYGLDQNPLVFVEDEAFHPGLSGLVAGRLKEKYGKPACVVSWVEVEASGEKEGRGSGRSVPGVHIAQAFIDARNEGLLEKGGGHAMAGGFTLLPEQREAFEAFLYAHIKAQADSLEPSVETVLDGVLSVRGAQPAFVKMIEQEVGPFGQAYPEPLFLFQNVRLHSVDIVGGAHIRLMISDWEGGARMKAVAFRAVGTDLGDALLKRKQAAFDLVGHLKLDDWGGREKVELHVRDAAFALEAQEEAL